jgi:L-alanine-DL-glutamate epimerase-like enolase superfamily enzyme
MPRRVLFLHGPGGAPELAKVYCSVEVALYDLVGKALGPDVELMVDAHAGWRMGGLGYPFEKVERVDEGMAPQRILWLKKPWLPEDHDAYRRLKPKGYVPPAEEILAAPLPIEHGDLIVPREPEGACRDPLPGLGPKPELAGTSLGGIAYG